MSRGSQAKYVGTTSTESSLIGRDHCFSTSSNYEKGSAEVKVFEICLMSFASTASLALLLLADRFHAHVLMQVGAKST